MPARNKQRASQATRSLASNPISNAVQNLDAEKFFGACQGIDAVAMQKTTALAAPLEVQFHFRLRRLTLLHPCQAVRRLLHWENFARILFNVPVALP